jgi:peptide/nickel transport system ATP-binding protein
MIPQGAMNSLNPVVRVRDQIMLAMRTHEPDLDKVQIVNHIGNLLESVGLKREVANLFPHELSGGMKQRVCIALAISLSPQVIIADEPTSALDVVVQRRIMQTLRQVQERIGAAVILVGHDMGLMAQLVDRVAVMYAGNLVEVAPVREAFCSPKHPYTQLLIESIPSIKERKPLKLTEGLTHDLRNPPPGCIFQFRCPHVMDVCRQVRPPLKELTPNHEVACHLYEEQGG